MTVPTLTHGHGYLSDMDSASYWGAKTDSGDALTGVSITCNDGDVIEIEGTTDNVGADEYVYYAYDMTNILSDTYPEITIRYKTSEASNGLGAKVVLVFTVGNQTVLDVSYSTSWTEVTVDVTAGKTIDSIQIWADDTDAAPNGTYQVYYDFAFIHKSTFSFPAVTKAESYELENEYAMVDVPGRSGAILQFLGSNSHKVTLSGVMDNWGTWGSGSGATQTFGEYLLDVFNNADTEAFQWFTSDLFNGKVVMTDYTVEKVAGSKSARVFSVTLVRYGLSGYDASSWS